MATETWRLNIDGVDYEEWATEKRVLDWEVEWLYNLPTTLTVIIYNADGHFSTGGAGALVRGDVVKLSLKAPKDSNLVEYLYSRIEDIDNKDDGTMVLICKDILVKGEGLTGQTHIFFENYIDNENFYEEGVGQVVDLTNSPVYASGDSVLEPPVKVQYIADKVPRATKRDGSQLDFSLFANRPIFQRFKTGVNMTTSDSIHCRIMFRKPNAGAPSNTYRVGVCPEDSNGDPDISSLLYGDTISWVDAGPWVKLEDFTWSGTILEPNAYYFLFIEVYSGATHPDDVEVGKAYINPYSEPCFAYDGANYPESPGSWIFALVVDVAESFNDLAYGKDYTVDQTFDQIVTGPDFVPDAKGSSTEHWPHFFRVSLYFKDATASYQKNAKDIVEALIRMGWKDIDQSIAGNFDSDANYRFPFYNLNGISILNALTEIGLHIKRLTGGKEGQIYTKWNSPNEEIHFKEAKTTSDAAVKGFNQDNRAKEADGSKNADFESGAVLTLELEKQTEDGYSRIRVIPEEFTDIVELNVYSGYPDYRKVFEEEDSTLKTYTEAMDRAEVLSEALIFDDWEGVMRVLGFYPAFNGGLDFACGDIIAIKSDQKGLSSATKFKVRGVRINIEGWTEFDITRYSTLHDKLKQNSDRIKELERFTSPVGLQDIVINIRNAESDATPGTAMAIRLQNSGSPVVDTAAITRKTAQTGHNHYQSYFPAYWNKESSHDIDNPITDIEMWETSQRHNFDLEDLTEDSWYPNFYKWSGVRVIINWDIGTA